MHNVTLDVFQQLHISEGDASILDFCLVIIIALNIGMKGGHQVSFTTLGNTPESMIFKSEYTLHIFYGTLPSTSQRV